MHLARPQLKPRWKGVTVDLKTHSIWGSNSGCSSDSLGVGMGYVGVCCCVWLSETPLTIAHQTPLPVEFSRQEYESGLPFSIPRDLPDLGINPHLLCLLHWQADSLLPHHVGSQGSGVGGLIWNSWCWGCNSDQFLQTLQEEVQAWAFLKPPHVMPMYNHGWEPPWNMMEIELYKLRTPPNASQSSLSRMEGKEFPKNKWVVFCTPLPLPNFKGERGPHRASPRMRKDAQSRCKGPHPANQGTTPQKPGSQLQAPDANETPTGGLQLPLLRPLSTPFLNPALPCPLGTIWSSKVGEKSSLTWCFILEHWSLLHQVSRGTPLYNQAVKEEIVLPLCTSAR